MLKPAIRRTVRSSHKDIIEVGNSSAGGGGVSSSGGAGSQPSDVLLDIDFFSQLPAGSNFTRDSANASFENAAGLIQFEAAANAPVFEYRNGLPLGLVMERAEVNNQSNSETFTGAGWGAPTSLLLGNDPAHINLSLIHI